MLYYAQRKSIKNGEALPINNRFGERKDMERQFHLYCAAACVFSDENDIDAIEWGTVEQGIIERKVYYLPTPEPEPEPEEEPTEGE